MDRTVEALALAGSGMPEFTPWALFLHADLIGKAVILVLVLASFWTWAIVIDKLLRLRKLQAAANQFEDQFWSGGSLEDLYDRVGAQPADPMTAMFGAAMREWRRSAAKGLVAAGQMRASLQARIERVMQVTLSREMDRLEKQMTFLASVGSTAPFIGLFGTVWGIMRSFHAIGVTKNTSIASVAPGLAEALFATALGLIAAIPAVIAYNKISSELNRYAGRLETFSSEFGAILSRQLEEKQ
jgi:biopolymer transport protein TolQ